MYGLGRVGHLGNSGGLGWVLPGASIDMNFKDGLYYGAAASQLAVSRASAAYADDLGGNWSQFASNVARITNKGLLSEESRTNSIRNNSGQGAILGTPGTPPTNWQVLSQTITSSIVGVGSENGIDYVDIRLNGNTAAIDHINIYFESTGQIAAGQGQTWACSSFTKLTSGTMSGLAPTGLQPIVEERGAGGTFLGFGATGPLTLTNAALTTQRWAAIYTTLSASIQSVLPGIIIFLNANQAIDITLRFGWPSLELGEFRHLSNPYDWGNGCARNRRDHAQQSSQFWRSDDVVRTGDWVAQKSGNCTRCFGWNDQQSLSNPRISKQFA